ncbi:MAG: RidA family protein [Bacteroidia bacterium]|nr:RidA family protein [Bacteroidia bacterium]
MRKNISSGAPWEETVGYSRAVRIGNWVAVSGTTAVENGVVAGHGSPYLQSIIVLNKIKTALEEAGASLEDVIRTRIYVTDMAHWPEVGRAHGEFFSKIKPAATMVAVSALIDPDLLVEIEADAVIPS